MSSYKQKFNKVFKQTLNQPNSKEDISKLTKIPIRFLDDVYDRALSAYEKTPKYTKAKVNANAYAYGRVYAFVVKRKLGNLDFDLDISSNIRKYKKDLGKTK